MVLKYPVFYMYIHSELERAAGASKIIRRKKAIEHLNRGHNIQKEIATAIVKEMENYNLLESYGQHRYKVNRVSVVNLISNPNKIYQKLGIF